MQKGNGRKRNGSLGQIKLREDDDDELIRDFKKIEKKKEVRRKIEKIED